MNRVSIKIQQPNGMELIHTADEIQFNTITKELAIKVNGKVTRTKLTPGMKAFVMNERASTIAIYKG